MEKYKYKFMNSAGENLGQAEAKSLNEAILKAGFNGYIARYCFPGFAVIDNGKYYYGVKWEPIK